MAIGLFDANTPVIYTEMNPIIEKVNENESAIGQKLDKIGGEMTGMLAFNIPNGGILSSNKQSRNFIAGGDAISILNGSYIVTEGADYGGIGQGGNILFALPANKGLVLGVADIGSQVRVLMSSGNPEGVKTAETGSLCIRVDTGKIYVKQSGSGNVGWKELSVSEAPVETIITTGFASGWSGTLKITKTQEGQISYNIDTLIKTTDILTSGEIVYTLPLELRPTKGTRKLVVGLNSTSGYVNNSALDIMVTTNGNMYVSNVGGVTANVRRINGVTIPAN